MQSPATYFHDMRKKTKSVKLDIILTNIVSLILLNFTKPIYICERCFLLLDYIKIIVNSNPEAREKSCLYMLTLSA